MFRWMVKYCWTSWVLFVVVMFLLLIKGCTIDLAHATEIDLGMDYLSAKDESRALVLGVNVPLPNEISLSSNIRYAKRNNEISQNQGFLRGNWDPPLRKHWSLWFYQQVGYDVPKEIDFEHFLGAGPKYTLYQSDVSKCSISTSYLNHYQELADGDTKNINRLSFRLKATHSRNKLQTKAVLFYQPNIEDPSDYLINGELSLSYPILQQVGIKAYVEDHYRSVSPIPQKNEFLMGLKLVFSF